MTWVKLDDQFDENLKVKGLSDSGFRLYVTLLCYCARKETDGRFSRGIAKSFGSPRAVKELIGAGLWVETDSGFEVKDYLTYNPSHAKLEAERARVKDRVDGHRERKRNTGCNGVTTGGGNGGGNRGTTSGGTDVPGSRISLDDLSDLRSGSESSSGSYQPKDLTGSAREDSFRESFTGPDDELPEGWQPNDENRALAARLKLTCDEELGLYSAHRRRQGFRCGAWDADFELWLRRSAKMARERAESRGRGTATQGGPSGEWPTEADLSLREAIRGGAHGARIKAKLAAGQLDAGLARRLIRERDAERRETAPEPGIPAAAVTALLAGVGRNVS